MQLFFAVLNSLCVARLPPILDVHLRRSPRTQQLQGEFDQRLKYLVDGGSDVKVVLFSERQLYEQEIRDAGRFRSHARTDRLRSIQKAARANLDVGIGGQADVDAADSVLRGWKKTLERVRN